ncbi:UDP-glycosyltransferase family 50 member B3 [Haematobia irritans]|uniref:UDP-glycosyltransferase family 50 member B3 n=1 Tax=Haematobia irritans TaxID=7368 RepID=UPI003F50140C
MNNLICTTIFLICVGSCLSADILMVTMGGTKSHKIPFWELAKGLIDRGHNITFLSGFPSDFHLDGLHEVTPSGLVEYIQNYTNWDLVGARMLGVMPISIWDGMRYPFQSCDAMLEDAETQALMNRNFDLAILDGAFPECALGMVYQYKIPFMYMNTVGFYTGSLSVSGNPAPLSITPNFYTTFTDSMNVLERASNTAFHIFFYVIHKFVIAWVHRVLKERLNNQIPHPYDISKNVSFILQNAHAVASYPRPLNPNIAEVACIHCKAAKPLPKDLEDFIASAGESGFIYVSMGSSVKAANMPNTLRRLMVQTFARLPYHVLWKYEGSADEIDDLSDNVMLSRWLPQQDILGHPRLRAFVTHGGLLSMFETVFHGVPVVTMPVFCDHDVNSAKAEVDGYAIKLELKTLTAVQLYKSIMKVIHDPQYRNAARYRQRLLLDQRSTPLETSVYWTEYVLRHKGAYHLQSAGRNLNWLQYYLIDVAALYMAAIYMIYILVKRFVLRFDVIKSLHTPTKAKKL